jgi:hypothetical protein
MKTLKQLGAVVALTFVLGLQVLGGEMSTPPCTPGDINTPPCATAQAPSGGETSTPPAATAPGQIDTPPLDELSLTEFASSVLLSIVSLF